MENEFRKETLIRFWYRY